MTVKVHGILSGMTNKKTWELPKIGHSYYSQKTKTVYTCYSRYRHGFRMLNHLTNKEYVVYSLDMNHHTDITTPLSQALFGVGDDK